MSAGSIENFADREFLRLILQAMQPGNSDPMISAFVQTHIVFVATILCSVFIVGCAAGRLWFDRAIATQKILVETHKLAADEARREVANLQGADANKDADDQSGVKTLTEALERKRVDRFFSAVATSAIMACLAYGIYVQTSTADALKLQATQIQSFSDQTKRTLDQIKLQGSTKTCTPKPIIVRKPKGHPADVANPN